ncbi:uncharacterized protein AKAME5_000876000 [Lates japonicus]|uniref:Uncharacterized protein n=1 Tax=Lates japonicus TaxID=270547 RepID=A0AAD3MLK6_LATJO|nr:uncharacterized protein AKAME5_000876000 [Lates japonicus]
MGEAASQHKRHYDKKAKAMPLLPGERVWVRERNRHGRGKLCTWWGADPYVILDKVGDTGVVYRVQPEKGGREQTVHRNALKLCTAPPADVLPPSGEPNKDSQRLTETQRLPEPLFYGFLPAALPMPPQDGQLGATPRRSTRPNFGQPPERAKDWRGHTGFGRKQDAESTDEAEESQGTGCRTTPELPLTEKPRKNRRRSEEDKGVVQRRGETTVVNGPTLLRRRSLFRRRSSVCDSPGLHR